MSDRYDYSAHYRKWHSDDPVHYDGMAAQYRRILAPCIEGLPNSARILEVGCAQGMLVYALDSWGFSDVEGIDVSQELIAVAIAKGLNCRRVRPDDIHRMAEEAPGRFDAIFLMDVLEHIPKSDQTRFVSSLISLLSHGGRLLLSVPNANSSFASRWRYVDWTHEISFTEASLEFLLRNGGGDTVEFYPYEYFSQPGSIDASWKLWAQWLTRSFFRSVRRLEAMAELGPAGRDISLSLNLLAKCIKK